MRNGLWACSYSLVTRVLHSLIADLPTGVSCRVLYSYLKPESVRIHHEATVRPWATVQVTGDALSFASALGYVYGRDD